LKSLLTQQPVSGYRVEVKASSKGIADTFFIEGHKAAGSKLAHFSTCHLHLIREISWSSHFANHQVPADPLQNEKVRHESHKASADHTFIFYKCASYFHKTVTKTYGEWLKGAKIYFCSWFQSMVAWLNTLGQNSREVRGCGGVSSW
jgi:hypothetical protein